MGGFNTTVYRGGNRQSVANPIDYPDAWIRRSSSAIAELKCRVWMLRSSLDEVREPLPTCGKDEANTSGATIIANFGTAGWSGGQKLGGAYGLALSNQAPRDTTPFRLAIPGRQSVSALRNVTMRVYWNAIRPAGWFSGWTSAIFASQCRYRLPILNPRAGSVQKRPFVKPLRNIAESR